MNPWLWLLIQQILNGVSGPFRVVLEKSVLEWEAKAKETATPADDLVVGVVKWLLRMP